MRIPTAAIRQCAADCNIPAALYEQYQDIFESFALRVAVLQRKKDQQAVRAWYFNDDFNKPQMFKILDDVNLA